MAGGYIGLINVPDTAVLIPTIDSNFTVQVTESIPGGSPPASLSSAIVSIASLDVLSGHVFGITVEERVHNTWPTTGSFLPTDWNQKGMFTVDWDVGSNLSKNVVIGGISASVKGYGSNKTGIYHDFRVGFLNADNNLAVLNADDEGVVPGSVSGGVFTRTAGTWVSGEWVGRVANFKDASNTVLLSRPIYSNTATALTFKDDGVDLSTCTKVEIPSDNWQYDVGAAGVGQEFNGINDFAEFAEVLNLQVNINNIWSSSGDITGLQAQLRWDNMYDHASISAHPHADGANRDTTNDQWKSITRYVVFMYKANTTVAPASPYPDPAEANGKWYMVGEIEAPHEAYGSLNKINHTVTCPAGSSIAFWVGVATGVTKSKAEKNEKGTPPPKG